MGAITRHNMKAGRKTGQTCPGGWRDPYVKASRTWVLIRDGFMDESKSNLLSEFEMKEFLKIKALRP